ncbi:MAG: hypothetical protein IPO43_07815 [Rhodoferax sp.]|nr:hypothetical protein [Rhodoferax sp.]
MKPVLPTLGLALTLLPGAGAWAQWQASASAGLRQVQMAEVDSQGRLLVREHGLLPGLQGEAAYQAGDWRLSARADLYQHRIRYRGQVQDGPPLASNTGTRQGRVGFEAAHPLTAGSSLIGGFEWDHWRRDIEGHGSTLGLRERYTTWRWLTGAQTQWLLHSAASLTGSALLVLAQPERLRVRFDGHVYDDVDFKTRSASGLRLTLTLQPALVAKLSITAELDALNIRRSNDATLRQDGVAVGTVAQPRHSRRALGVRVNYSF